MDLTDGYWIWDYGGIWRIIEVKGKEARIVRQSSGNNASWVFFPSHGWRQQFDWEINAHDIFGLKANTYKSCTQDIIKRKLLEEL